jgi:predicted AlkP superfamily phosphohydrolase/phosphomutase
MTRSASRLATAAAALFLIALAAVFLVAAYDISSAPPAYDFRPVPRSSMLNQWKEPWAAPAAPAEGCDAIPSKWMVVGLDGASWDIILPLVEAGDMPNLATLMREGAYGDMQSFRPTTSPALWTTVATGVSPARHGITGFTKEPSRLHERIRKILGRKRRYEFYSNSDRRVKAFWNILSERGKRVLVVGYHNTFPAEKVNGMMVSNYLMHSHIYRKSRRRNADMAAFTPSLVYPPKHLPKVMAFNRPLDSIAFSEIEPFADIRSEDFERLRSEKHEVIEAGDQRWAYLQMAYLYETTNAKITEHFYPILAPDVLMVHFQMVDWMGHYFLAFHWPDSASPKHPSKEFFEWKERGRNTLREFYRYADSWIGRLTSMRDEATAVMIVSDHGFERAPDDTGRGEHKGAPPGILVMQGPGIRKNFRIPRAALYDVLPTLAAGMGLPVARDWEGRVLKEAFCAETFESNLLQLVASYESGLRYVPAVELPRDMTHEMEEQLRSLGYIQ